MEPELALVIGALTAGGVAGTKEVAAKGVHDAYGGLKALILRRARRPSPDVAQALRAFEEEQAAARAKLAERLREAGIEWDAETLAQAKDVTSAAAKHSKNVYKRIGVLVQGDKNRIKTTINHDYRGA